MSECRRAPVARDDTKDAARADWRGGRRGIRLAEGVSDDDRSPAELARSMHEPIRSRPYGEGPTTMLTTATTQMAVCLRLTKAISRAQCLDDIYGGAPDALGEGLGIARSSVLLFDPDGVMRFKAWRGLSQEYRRAVEGHTPWTPDAPEPEPVTVEHVHRDPALASFLPALDREGIAA